MGRYVTVILLVIACIYSTYCQYADDYCVTPDSAPGNCVVLKNCSSLYTELIKAVGIERQRVHAKLKRYSCGFIRFDPKVCCPVNVVEPTEDPSPFTIDERISEEPPDVSRHAKIGMLPTECGLFDQDRITGGDKTKLREFPWMALLSYSFLGRNDFRCGGTIINQNYILTAAHCVISSVFRLDSVRVGESNLATEPDCTQSKIFKDCTDPVQDIEVEETTVHPQYSTTTLQNDIALIRLKHPINFTYDNVDPICLPITPQQRDFKLSNQNLTVAGWGITENATASKELLKVVVPTVSLQTCMEEIQRVSSEIKLSNKQICAGGVLGKDSCSGDSGGPLKTVLDKKYVQIGIVSFGSLRCGATKIPGVYTNTAYYVDWILNQIKP